MKINQTAKSFWLAAAGALIAVTGTFALFLLLKDLSPQERILLGLNIYFGWWLFFRYLNKSVVYHVVEKYPTMKHEIIPDERNQTILHIAQSKAYEVVISLFVLLIIIYANTQLEAWFLYALIAALLLSKGAMIYFLVQMHKEM